MGCFLKKSIWMLIVFQRTEASESVRPFTISQLSRASQAHNDAEWKVDDIEVGQVNNFSLAFKVNLF